MAQIQYKRIIFIIWKWKHLIHKDAKSFHAIRNVENNEDHLIVEISDNLPFEEMLPIVRTFIQEPETEYLFLIHKKSAYTVEQKRSVISIHKMPAMLLAEFGGGTDYIYYDPDRGTGFLDNDGEWAHRLLYFKKDNTKNKPVILTESGELIEKHFIPVWRHYYSQYATQLLQMQHTLIIELEYRYVIKKEPMGKKISEVLSDDIEKLTNLLDKMQVEYNNEDMRRTIGSLKNWIEQTPLQSNLDIHEFNQQLVDLLDLTGEPVA